MEEQEIHKIDLRVGKILSVEQHPEADELYVEQIDLGEPEPRTIISGLRNFLAMEELQVNYSLSRSEQITSMPQLDSAVFLQGRSVIVVSNLKPRTMRGIKSSGMLLCASNSDHTVVDPVTPPRDACVGERVFFGQGGEAQAEAASPNQVRQSDCCTLWTVALFTVHELRLAYNSGTKEKALGSMPAPAQHGWSMCTGI